MKTQPLKRYILEKVTIKNLHYQQLLDNFLTVLESMDRPLENYQWILEYFLQLPLFCNCILWNHLLDHWGHCSKDLYIQYLPNNPFRTKYNNIFNDYKKHLKPLIEQWIGLNKNFNGKNWERWTRDLDIYNNKFFQTTRMFLKLKFLTSQGKFNIRNYVNNNNYQVLNDL